MTKYVFRDGHGNELSPGFYTLKQVGYSMNMLCYIYKDKNGDQEAIRIMHHGSKDYDVQVFKIKEGIVNISSLPLKKIEKKEILEYLEWKKRSINNLEGWLDAIDFLEKQEEQTI